MSIYAFIDSQNVHFSTKQDSWELDWHRLFVFLQSKYRVQKVFLFLGYISVNEDLYNYLRKIGYCIVFKPTVKNHKGKTKGNCDAELVLHCAKIEYNNFNKAIIISNDGDFYCLAEFLDSQNKLLKVITPSKRYSGLLRPFARYIVPMNLFQHKIIKKRDIPAV